MPNKPDINTDIVSVQCSVETRFRLEKLAKERGVSRSACAASILREGVSGVVLGADDYRKIADLIEKRRTERIKS